MSDKKRIERMKITTFRGATQPVEFQFHSKQPIVLIFGENGSGKSTIADALDFVCNNDFGSLQLRSGTTPKTQIVSALGQPQDLEVEMVYGGDTWRAKLHGGKPVTSPECPPRAFILRRADITRIMEATDGKRYETLKEFITVPKIDDAESALRTAWKTVADDVEQSIRQKDIAVTTLQQFWAAEGKPDGDYITWAQKAVQQQIVSMEKQVTDKKNLREKLDTAVRTEIELSTEETNYQKSLQERIELDEQMQQASQVQANADLVLTLQAAKTYLHKHTEANHCPVCAKPEPHNDLVAQINGQLNNLQSIQALHDRLEQNKNALQREEGAKSVANQKWLSASADLFNLLLGSSSSLLTGISEVPTPPESEAFRSILQRLAQNRSTLQAEIEQGERVVAQHNALSTHIATIDELTTTMETKHAISQRLQAMLAVLEEERKRYVQDTVDGISATVSQLYARIHPDEPLGELSFGIKPNTAGSLTMKGKFGTNDNVPLVGYYSEAHLDTLGLCVYLALAKQDGNALVMLDDILMSVDDPHLDRVIELINEEAPNFGQIIITTHSRAWFNRARLGKGMPAEIIELYGWDLNNGMHHDHAPLAVDELRNAVHVTKLDRQAVASKAGILLEQILDDITLRYGSRLPRKQVTSYTLGELTDGIDNKLRKLLRVEQFDETNNLTRTIELLSLIENATADSWIRNQVGAHFNVNEAGISDDMVRTFGENALAIADAILCDHCRQLPTKNKSGSFWECGGRCGRVRLYPLVAPNKTEVANIEDRG
jgi:energy-coupling factor transporter ATP-binding protein EcfA2